MFDAWVTTLIGVATMIVTLILVWSRDINFIWEGIGGLAIGTILLLAPKTIEKKVSDAIRSLGGRNGTPTDQPPGE